MLVATIGMDDLQNTNHCLLFRVVPSASHVYPSLREHPRGDADSLGFTAVFTYGTYAPYADGQARW